MGERVSDHSGDLVGGDDSVVAVCLRVRDHCLDGFERLRGHQERRAALKVPGSEVRLFSRKGDLGVPDGMLSMRPLKREVERLTLEGNG
jgi:hypothetical protein